jgi:hypothetical protein
MLRLSWGQIFKFKKFKEGVELFLDTHCADYQPQTKAEVKRPLGKLSSLDAKQKGVLDRNQPSLMRSSTSRKRSEANHLFKAARTFFRWCIRRRFITISPPQGLSLPQMSDAALAYFPMPSYN